MDNVAHKQGHRWEVTAAEARRIQDEWARLVVREGRQANFSVRELPLESISKAVVQVEFSPPSKRELELAGQPGKEAPR